MLIGRAAELAELSRGSAPVTAEIVERADALAIYARLLLSRDDDGEMPGLAERAVEDARAAGAADAEANLLVTLGLYREAAGADPGVAEVFARARDLAAADGSPLVAGRAAFHCARTRFDRGDLAAAARAADEGARFVLDNGFGWSTPGSIIRSLRYLIHYTAGNWDEAIRLAGDFAVRVVRPHEAQMSAYALFVEVAQGSPAADERLRWITPLLGEDLFPTTSPAASPPSTRCGAATRWRRASTSAASPRPSTGPRSGCSGSPRRGCGRRPRSRRRRPSR